MQDLDKEHALLPDVLAALRTLPLQTIVQVEAAQEVTRDLLIRLDEVEAAMKLDLTPFKAGEKEVRDRYRPLLDGLVQCIDEIKGRVAKELQAQAHAKQATLALASQALQAGNRSEALALVNQSTQVATPVKGVGLREEWRATIVAPDLVPRAWCEPAESRINRHAKACPASSDPEPIPGVEFKLVPITSYRRK